MNRALAHMGFFFLAAGSVALPLIAIFEPHNRVTSLGTHLSINVISYIVGFYVSHHLTAVWFPKPPRKA